MSIETVRRWAESGRIKAERTAGGHRRFAPAEVNRLKGGQQSRLRPIATPQAPLPALGELLALERDELLHAAPARLYSGAGTGWFADPASRPVLERWADELAERARSGEWGAVVGSTQRMLESAALQGASLLERHGFLETFGALVLRELGALSPSADEFAAARRLFASLRQRLLYEQDVAPDPAGHADAEGLPNALAELLTLPDLEWVAVYEAEPGSLELGLRAYAGSEETPCPLPARCGFGSGPVGRLALTRRPAVEQGEMTGGHTTALAPMVVGSDLVGVLALGLRRARPVREHDLQLLEALAGALALAQRSGAEGARSLPQATSTFRAGWAAPSRPLRAV